MTESAPLVWVTRTPEGARRTARAIEAKGYRTLVAPVLKIQALKPIIDPHGFDAVIFTSRNGLNAFSALCSRRALTAWCVGDSTATAAREKGFQQVISAAGDVKALTDMIRQQADRHSRLFYAAPAEPASALGKALRADGFLVSEAAVYETQFVVPRFNPVDLPHISHVLVQSPKAGRAIAEALIAYHDKLCFPNLRFICISEAAWQGVETGLRQSEVPEIRQAVEAGLDRRIAATPDEAAMLRLLKTDG
ncbi:MAG TPA: uroporphyrinogen-III synthase [Asticcacaulis sp.]|nr:uroporphyrinogen-III synthase [Asticcacaulis sp.]